MKGAAVISLGGFISKAIGAVYRIPLLNILGGEGMGIYQMVYPLYCILLTLSASGIPTGIARLVSSGNKRGAERTAFRFYSLAGLVGTGIMFILSEPLAALQGEGSVALCCRMLCPSVFFVSVLSVVRGYFQGRGNMYPTAFTEVGEQVVKVAFGCAIAYMYRYNTAYAVGGALAAVTISEGVCAALAYLYYLGERERLPLYKLPSLPLSDILKYTLPLTLTALALPLSQLAESVVSVRLLKGVTEDAVALYGLYSGCAMTLVNLPASLCYGLAAASVPRISPLASSGDYDGAKKRAYSAILCTLFLSLPMAAALYFLSPVAAKIIFPSLSGGERETLINLVSVLSPCAVTQSLMQTTSACLTSLGRPDRGALTQWIGGAARVGVGAIFIYFTNLSIYGAAVAANLSFLIATFINICYIIVIGGKHEDKSDRIGSKERRFDPAGEGGT